MKTDITFEVRAFEAVRMIGKEVIVGKQNPVPELWQHMLGDGSIDSLQALPGRVSPLGDTIGWMGEYQPKTKAFTYIAGVWAQPGTPPPAGFAYRDIPACLMGIGWITGKTSELEKGAHQKTEKIMRQQGYEPDYSVVGISMEYYSFDKYAAIKEDGRSLFTFGYFLPCRKMQEA